MRYLDVAYPAKPADYADYMAALAAVLRGYGVGEADLVHAIRTIRCTLHGVRRAAGL